MKYRITLDSGSRGKPGHERRQMRGASRCLLTHVRGFGSPQVLQESSPRWLRLRCVQVEGEKLSRRGFLFLSLRSLFRGWQLENPS